MNRIFNLVWDKTRHQIVVTSELARGGKKTGSGPRKRSAGSNPPRKAVPLGKTVVALVTPLMFLGAYGTAFGDEGIIGGGGTIIGNGPVEISGPGGSFNFDNSKITSTDNQSHGVWIYGGANESIKGATITTSGEGSYGIKAEDENTLIEMTEGEINTYGQGSDGVNASLGSTAAMVDVDITTNEREADAVVAEGAGSTIDLDGGTVQTNYRRGPAGIHTHAMIAKEGGSITGEGLEIKGSNDGYFDGVVSVQKGSRITLSDSSINNTMQHDDFSAAGATADGEAAILRLNGTSVSVDSNKTTNGSSAGAIGVTNGGEVLINKGASAVAPDERDSISTTGDWVRGIIAANGTGNNIAANNIAITTDGDNAYGIQVGDYFQKDDSSVTVNNSGILTKGEDAYGVRTYGIKESTAKFSGTDLTIATEGAGADGVHAEGGGSQFSLHDSSVSTIGQNASGVFMDGVGTLASKAIIAGTSISVAGDGSDAVHLSHTGSYLELDNVTLEATGAGGIGLYIHNGSEVTATDVNITVGDSVTAHDAAPRRPRELGVDVAAPGSSLTMNGGSITTLGADDIALNADRATVNAMGVTLISHGDHSEVLKAYHAPSNDPDTPTVLTFKSGQITADGKESIGVRANAHGHKTTVTVSDSTITMEGEQSIGAATGGGGEVTLENTMIEAMQDGSTGLYLDNSGTITLVNTKVKTSGASITSDLTEKNQTQSINVGSGSNLTTNNGTLLLVNRTADGADGNVILTLGKGSVSSGVINDTQQLSAADRGKINLVLQPGAVWNGYVEGQLGDTNVSSGSNFAPREDTTINGDIDNKGRVTAGSGTTITTTSDYTSSDNSTLAIGIGANGGGKVLLSQGTATIDDGSELAFVGQPNSQGGTYVFLDAPKIDGRYDLDNVTVNGKPLSGLAFYQLGVVGDPQYVLTSLPVNAPGVADTANEQGVADGIASLNSSNSVQQTVHGLSYSDARQAFNALSGEFYASRQTVLLNGTRHLRQAVSDRLSQHCTDTTETDSNGQTLCGRTVWVQAYGDWGHINGDNNVARVNHHVGGVFIGADQSLTDHVQLGFVIGYGHGDSDIDDSRNSHGRYDSYHLGLYTGAHYGALKLKAGLAHTWYNLDSHRSVQYPGFNDTLSVSNNHANNTQAFAEVGYAFDFDVAQVTPFVRGAYVHLHTDGFTEDGGAAALSGDSTSNDIGTSLVGVRLSRVVSRDSAATFRLNGLIGWQHTFGDITPEQSLALHGGESYTVSGVSLNRDAVAVKAGFDGQLNPNVTVGLSYVGKFGDGTAMNGVKGTFTWAF